MLRAALRILFCLVIADLHFAYAQSSWQTFSPPDKNFTVELPRKPQVPEKKEESLDFIFENVRSAYTYVLRMGQSDPLPELTFGVVQLTKPLSDQQFNDTVNSNMLVIGGDDKHFSKEADVTVNGLHGREFIYGKGITSGRTLFINGGRRIYVVLFSTEAEGEISSEAVSRVFRTFQPMRRVRN